jgi:hypothetical protein
MNKLTNKLFSKVLDLTQASNPLVNLADALLSHLVRKDTAAASCYISYGRCFYSYYYYAYVQRRWRCCYSWWGRRCRYLGLYYC